MKVSGFEGAEVEVGDDFLDDEEWVKFEEAETGRQVVTLLMGWETAEQFEAETRVRLEGGAPSWQSYSVRTPRGRASRYPSSRPRSAASRAFRARASRTSPGAWSSSG